MPGSPPVARRTPVLPPPRLYLPLARLDGGSLAAVLDGNRLCPYFGRLAAGEGVPVSHYDDVYLAETEDVGLGDLDRAQLIEAIDRMEAALEDPDRGGPPGWRKRTEQVLREARQRLAWLGADDEEEDDGK